MTRFAASVLLFGCCAAAASPAAAQNPELFGLTAKFIAGDPSVGPVVRGAPYSGEGVTTVTQLLADGTRIERTSTTKLYRDAEGRVRREQTLLGLEALDPAADAPSVVMIVDPIAGVSYVLEPHSRRARRGGLPRFEARQLEEAWREGRRAIPPPPPPPPGLQTPQPHALPTPPPPPPPLAESRSPLGTKVIDGVEANGTRTTVTIPAGRIGNDRPIEITDERWESPALRVLLHSRHHDPRTGDVEYRLTNISRAEPPHDLFVVPADYTVVEARDERRERR